jgi:hydroxymethylbilane synthase
VTGGVVTDRVVRIGTRGSALALAQTAIVAAALRERWPALRVEVVTITTRGDVRTDVPLSALGGRGVFAAEIEQALRTGEVDLAVHSAKDLPSTLAPDMCLAAALPRADARDVLVARAGVPGSIRALPAGAVVGTGSPRREGQLRALRPDLDVRDIRGNVDTRLRKLDAGDYDAIVLAAAGLRRLGLAGRVTEWIAPADMLPAVGQGVIAVEARADDAQARALAAPLDDPSTATALAAERAFLARLGAGCAAPTGAHAVVDAGGRVCVEGLIGSRAGDVLRLARDGAASDAASVGAELADALLAAGGDELLRAAGARAGVE